MALDFTTLDALRTHHPAWRLLRSDHAPLKEGFLHRVFAVPNVPVMVAVDLAETLGRELNALHQHRKYGIFRFLYASHCDCHITGGAVLRGQK